MAPDLHLDDPQWFVDHALGWGSWKVLDAIISHIGKGGNGADHDFGSLLGGGAGDSPASLKPFLDAAAEVGLTPQDIQAALFELRAPESPLRRVLADVLRPDFATPQAALANLKERLAELDPLDARIVLALVAGASRAANKP